jgi:hypothetical protein
MRRAASLIRAGAIALLICVSAAAGTRAAAREDPTGPHGHFDSEDARSPGFAPVSPSSAHVPACELRRRGPGAPPAVERLSRDARGASFDLNQATVVPVRLDVVDVFARRVFTRRPDGPSGRFSVPLPRDVTRARRIHWSRHSQAGARVSRRFPLLN